MKSVCVPGRLQKQSFYCGIQKSFKMRTILNLCNIYRRVVSRFGKISTPLTMMLEMEEPTQFFSVDQEYRAIEELENRYMSFLGLAIP